MVDWQDIQNLPQEYESRKLIRNDTPKALAYLAKTGNLDLIEVLGMTFPEGWE